MMIGLISLLGLLLMSIPINADASIPININATLVSRNTDGTSNKREQKLARQDCKVGGQFPIPEVKGYSPDITDIPKFITPNMANQQHQLTYYAEVAKVIVNYVDQTQQKLQSQTILDKGTIDGKYQIDNPQISDYELLNPDKLTGSITQTEQIITLKFKNKTEQPEKDPKPDPEPEQPDETKPEKPDQPDEDLTPEEPDLKKELSVTIQQLTDSGKLLQQEVRQLTDEQLQELFHQQWALTGYQFNRYQYDDVNQVLKIIYHPCSVNVVVVARDTLGNQLTSERVTGEFGSSLTINAPIIKGYQAKVQSQIIQVASLKPAEVVFIYEPETTMEEIIKSDKAEAESMIPETAKAKPLQVDNDLLSTADQKIKPASKGKPTKAAVKFINPKRSSKPNSSQVLKRSAKKLPQTSEANIGGLLTVLGTLTLMEIGWLKLKSKRK
ncbi:MucBP domain-containing protein [Lentilactobacillus senioris]|uniref:MucBP domain-containing protein n=1 Tax=Lentilactobacillus senioris TaxID=931534 RepID=UPI00227FF6EB|nr:MucBP domain-containing protein [Lentilactobacillus senioris]MCY9807212.1 MucBP domain-containing protein [Lentilactobacillus senioris]